MSKSILILFFSLAIINVGCIRKNEPIKKKSGDDSTLANSVSQVPTLKEFLFVGMIGKKSGLYKYNLSAKNYTVFWQNNKEEVVDFSYSPDKKAAFFLTANQLGKKGVFPFIDKVKLYFVNIDSGSVKFVENIGNGLQIFSFWETDNSFKVILNIMDVTVGKYVDQKIKTYDASGKKLLEEKKTYDLVKDGFPQNPVVPKNIISPDKKYSIKSIDSAQTQIYLIDHTKNDEQTLLTKQNQKLNIVDWSIKMNYLFFSTIDISPMNETLYDPQPNTSKLFIYSLLKNKMVQTIEGSGVRNFLLSGDRLLYDDGFKDKSLIIIYDLQAGEAADSIMISGGCGIRNIPLIPDYEA